MESEYPFPPITEKVKGTDLAILGVDHRMDFFYEHDRFFLDFVSGQDALAMEETHLPLGDNSNFFGLVARIAFEQQKPIYQVDPGNLATGYSGILLSIAGVGIAGGSLAMLDNKESKPSRREVLKRIAWAAFGANLAFSNLPYKGVQAAISPSSLLNYGPDDLLAYGETDYRNIAIADGLERLCHERPGLKNIGAIHGAGHWKTVHAYLKSPELRLKRLAYLPFDIVGDTGVREYRPAGFGWELASEF